MGIIDADWPYTPIETMEPDDVVREMMQIHGRMRRDKYTTDPGLISSMERSGDEQRYATLEHARVQAVQANLSLRE